MRSFFVSRLHRGNFRKLFSMGFGFRGSLCWSKMVQGLRLLSQLDVSEGQFNPSRVHRQPMLGRLKLSHQYNQGRAILTHQLIQLKDKNPGIAHLYQPGAGFCPWFHTDPDPQFAKPQPYMTFAYMHGAIYPLYKNFIHVQASTGIHALKNRHMQLWSYLYVIHRIAPPIAGWLAGWWLCLSWSLQAGQLAVISRWHPLPRQSRTLEVGVGLKPMVPHCVRGLWCKPHDAGRHMQVARSAVIPPACKSMN